MSKVSLLVFSVILGIFTTSNIDVANAIGSQQKEDIEKEIEKSKEDEDTGMPEFTVSGNAAFSLDFSNPDISYYKGEIAPSTDKTSKDSSMPRGSTGEADVVFGAKGKLHNGVIYGAKLVMDTHKGDTGIDQGYLYFERDNFGTLQLGNLKGPEAKMLCGGQQLLGGTIGIDGVVPHDIDFAVGVISPLNMYGFSSKATKIAYYTPRMYGFQFGFSFTPDTKHIGHADKDWTTGSSSNGNDSGIYNKGLDETQRPSGRNNIGLGLTHQYSFNDDWSYKIAIMGVFENTRPIKIIEADNNGQTGTSSEIKLRNVCSFQTTASIKYKKFTLGMGYLNNGKGRMPRKEVYQGKSEDYIPGGFLTTKDGNAGQAWNIGAKYEYGKWEFSTVYHNISRKVAKSEKVKGNVMSFAVDYLICPGLKVFGEFDYVYSKSCDTACKMYNLTHKKGDKGKADAIKKQNTVVFAIGAQVTF